MRGARPAVLAALAILLALQAPSVHAGAPGATAEAPRATDIDPRLLRMRVRELRGLAVTGAEGGRLGASEAVLRGLDDDRVYVLIAVRGGLGLRDLRFAVPLEALRLADGRLAMIEPYSAEALKRAAEGYRPERYGRVLDSGKRLADLVAEQAAP